MFWLVIKFVVEFLPAVVLAFGGLGLLQPLIEEWLKLPVETPVKSIAAIVLGFLYVLLLRWVSTRGDSFEWLATESRRFVEYYTRWYSREGDLHVYCKDLHWLERPDRESIVNALCRKADGASVYVRDDTGPIVKKLREAGVSIYIVPDSIQVIVKFSLLDDNGHREIIIRSKLTHSGAAKRQKTKERVQESSDENLLSLALEFLESLRRIYNNA